MKYKIISFVVILLLSNTPGRSETLGQSFANSLIELRPDFKKHLVSSKAPLVEYSPSNFARSWISALVDVAERRGAIFVMVGSHEVEGRTGLSLVPLAQSDLEKGLKLNPNAIVIGIKVPKSGKFESSFEDLAAALIAVRSITENKKPGDNKLTKKELESFYLKEFYKAKQKFLAFRKEHLSDWVRDNSLDFSTEESKLIENLDYARWEKEFGKNLNMKELIDVTSRVTP